MNKDSITVTLHFAKVMYWLGGGGGSQYMYLGINGVGGIIVYCKLYDITINTDVLSRNPSFAHSLVVCPHNMQNVPRPGVLVAVISVISTNVSPVTGVEFQAAVPKASL